MTATLYLAAGIGHLVIPDKLLLITPGWVPPAREVILVTGILEIAGALALVTRPLRIPAGIALALYVVRLAGEFQARARRRRPAVHRQQLVYHGPRPILQPLIIWASLYAAGAIDWPLRARNAPR